MVDSLWRKIYQADWTVLMKKIMKVREANSEFSMSILFGITGHEWENDYIMKWGR